MALFVARPMPFALVVCVLQANVRAPNLTPMTFAYQMMIVEEVIVDLQS